MEKFGAADRIVAEEISLHAAVRPSPTIHRAVAGPII
jgi:hypothetical protein